MNKKDKIAFLISALILFCGILPFLDGEAAGLILWAPVAFYWLYRYFNKDISFLNQ